MLFTVIVPAYNAEHYLDEALNSISVQSFPDFEAIIIDDGSQDSTGAIVDAFAAGRSNVRVVHQENAGPLLARRRGLEEARGDYVVFLDSDDCLRADALETIAAAIEVTGSDIISYSYSRDSSFSHADDDRSLSPGLYEGDQYQRVLEYACGGRFNSLWGKAIRLCHIDFDTVYGAYAGLMHGEDLFQLLPILACAKSLVRLDEVLYFYRVNESSSTARYRSSQLADIVRVNRRLLEYAQLWGGGCPDQAIVGESIQYLALLKMSELSDADKDEKRAAFMEIRTAMEREYAFERATTCRLRTDIRLIYDALERGSYGVAHHAIQFVEALKRLGLGARWLERS